MSTNRRDAIFRHLIAADSSDCGIINFDNAATTPPFGSVMKEIFDFAHCYSSVRRGSGKRADYCSGTYERTRAEILKFFGADGGGYTAIFTKNTTESLNRLANLIPDKSGTVIVTEMEHHSNDLPWRQRFNLVVHAKTDNQGRLDMDSLEQLLRKHEGNIAVVSVTGASNVTGFINPIRELSSLVHFYDAQICVDAAQLAPHRTINMKDEGIDYLAFSAHKLYAPFGVGVLIGREDLFRNAEPDFAGGGTVDIVTENFASWADSPARFEAGTPNLMGVAALGASLRTLKEAGMNNISSYEAALADYAAEKLSALDGIKLFSGKQGIGVITFNLDGFYHKNLAEKLSYEAGIEVRSGCFCAQPYVQKLLGIKAEDVTQYSDSKERPGMVRISLGLYNTYDEVDRLCDYLLSIRGGVR